MNVIKSINIILRPITLLNFLKASIKAKQGNGMTEQCRLIKSVSTWFTTFTSTDSQGSTGEVLKWKNSSGHHLSET